jgi:hypothetical protein
MTDATALTTPSTRAITARRTPEFDQLVDMVAPTDEATAGVVAPTTG